MIDHGRYLENEESLVVVCSCLPARPHMGYAGWWLSMCLVYLYPLDPWLLLIICEGLASLWASEPVR